MTFPTAALATDALDSTGDNPQLSLPQIKAAVDQLNSLRNWMSGSALAMPAAATMDIGGQASSLIHVASGAGTTITSLGATYNGPVWISFGVPVNMTYNLTTLVLPNGVNHSFTSGDVAVAIPKGSPGASDGWRVIPIIYSGSTGIGASPSANATLALGRRDVAAEGGQLDIHRASDNAVAFQIDCYTTGGVDYLRVMTASGVAFSVDQNGNVLIGALAVITSPLDINGNRLRLRSAKTPTSASDTGVQGEVCWDSNYIYVCVATNSWKRVGIAAW